MLLASSVAASCSSALAHVAVMRILWLLLPPASYHWLASRVEHKCIIACSQVEWRQPPQPLFEFFQPLRFTLPKTQKKWRARVKNNLWYYRQVPWLASRFLTAATWRMSCCMLDTAAFDAGSPVWLMLPPLHAG